MQARVKDNPSFAQLASEAWLHEGSLRVMWARSLLELGRRAEALRQVDLAAAAYGHHPQLSSPRYYLGQLYLRLGVEGRARGELERFLELEPEGPRADAVRRALDRKEPVPPLAR